MEEIQTAVKTCLKKYAEFNGRAARPEFWWFMLAQFILHVILGMISPALDGLAALALLIPSLAAGSRRLHDIGKSGWLQLLSLIPIIGWILLIYWCAQPGEPGDNSYGPAPTGAAAVPDVAPGQQ